MASSLTSTPLLGQTGTEYSTQPPVTTSNLTSYAQTGLLPNTQTSTTPKTVAVVTSDPAKQTIQKQQSAVADMVNTTNTYKPLLNYLSSQGQAGSMDNLTSLAKQYGIQNYVGTDAQNQQLTQMVQQEQQKPTEQKPQQQVSVTSYQDNPDGTTTVTYSDGTTGVGRYTKNADGTYNFAEISKTNNNTVKLDPYQAEYASQMDKAYQNYSDTIKQIFNGTFLTPDQQAQISATQATFDRIKTEQQKANANYEKLREQAAFVGGQNVVDPTQFLAQKQQVIQSGLDKIAQIDVAATKALSELKQSFMDKNYKMANDAYTTLSGYLKEKNTLIQKAVDDARALEKDIRDYNFNVEKEQYKRTQDTIKNEQDAVRLADELLTSASNRETAAMTREKLAWDIKKIRNDITAEQVSNQFLKDNSNVGGSGTGAVSYMKALTSAMVGLPENQRAELVATMKGYIAAGDTKAAQELLMRTSFKNQTGTQQEDALRRLEALASLRDVKNALNQYVEKTGDTSLTAGTMQKVLTRLGNTTDPELIKIRTQITQSLQQYRNAVTGAAWGQQEDDEYRSIFPDIANTNKLNQSIVDSMISALDKNQRIRLGSAMGMSNYDEIFNPQQPKTAEETLTEWYKDPTMAPKIEQLVADNPNLSADEILQILEP